MFKFATERPDVAALWAGVCNNKKIVAKEGASQDQVRFIIYLLLILEDDFHATKTALNNSINDNSLDISKVINRVGELTTKKFNFKLNLDKLPYDLSIFAASTPGVLHPVKVMLRMALLTSSHPVHPTRFIALVLGCSLTGEEMQEVLVDIDSNSEYLTEFKLCYYREELLKFIVFSEVLPPLLIKDLKHDTILSAMKDFIHKNSVLGITTTTVLVPELKLFTTTSEKTTTPAFKVGDTVRLAPNMKVGNDYSGVTYLSQHTFSVTAEVKTVSVENNITRIKILGLDLWYAPEMLEHTLEGN